MTTEEVDFGCCEFCGCQYLSAHGKKRHERLNHLHKMNSSLSMPDEPPIVDVAPLPAAADTRPLLHLEADMSLDTIPDCFRTVHSNNWALEFDSEPDWSDTGADLSNMSIDPSVLGKLTPPTTHLGFHNSEPSDQESEQSFPNPTSMEAADPSKYEDRGSPSFCDSDDTSHQSQICQPTNPVVPAPLVVEAPDDDSVTREEWYQKKHVNSSVHPEVCDDDDSVNFFYNQTADIPDDTSATGELYYEVPEDDFTANGGADYYEDVTDDEVVSTHTFQDANAQPEEDPTKWSPGIGKGDFDPNKHDIHPAEEHLMIILRRHRLKIGLYSVIMDWARLATRHDKPYTFDSKRTYKRTMKYMKLKYDSTCGGAPIKCPPFQFFESLPQTFVYKFPLVRHIKRMLLDPELMGDFRLGFNPVTNDAGVRTYGEPNSAKVWEKHERQLNNRLAEARRAGLPVPEGSHYIAMFQGFDDGTICDNVGRLSAQPFLATLLNFSPEVRRRDAAWFILGMIPPYPKTSAERKKDKSQVANQDNYLEFYHKCLGLILEELLHLESLPYGIPFRLADKRLVHLHFRLSMIMGDTKGHEDMCCHFNSHSSNIKRMVRDCTVSQLCGDDVNHICEFTKQAEVRAIVLSSIEAVKKRDNVTAARNAASDISQALVAPVYWKFDYGGCPHGIFGILPYEMLHLFFLGLMKYLLFVAFEYVIVPILMQRWYNERTCHGGADSFHENYKTRPSNVDGKKLHSVLDKSEFERRFRIINIAARRQSDRSMPKCPFKNGVTDLTRLTGQEYPGLCLITAITMKGMYTWKVFDPAERKYLEDKEKRMIHLLLLSLSMAQMLSQDSYDVNYLSLLKARLSIFLKVYRKTVGPVRECFSKSGLRISKFHALLHFPFYILRYGSPYNFFGGFGESMMKVHLKQVAKNTSRRQDNLDKDVMHRHHEDHVCAEGNKELHRTNYIPVPPPVELEETMETTLPEQHADPSLSSTMKARLHNPVFFAVLQNGLWEIQCGKARFHRPIYPTVPNFEEGDLWVKEILDYAQRRNKENKEAYLINGDTASEDRPAPVFYSEVEFSYACDFPSNTAGEHDTFRCHPDFHSCPHKRLPWHDWAMINWVHHTGRHYQNAAKVLLWAKVKDPLHPTSYSIVCAVNCLGSSDPKLDTHIPFAIGDAFEQTRELQRKVRLVTPEEIHSVAYVVPAWSHNRVISKAAHRNNPNLAVQLFPNHLQEHKYFAVIPPRANWCDNSLWEHQFSMDCSQPTAEYVRDTIIPPVGAQILEPQDPVEAQHPVQSV